MISNVCHNPAETLVIELTYDCNMRCPWCVEARHVGTKQGPLSPEAFEKIMKRILERKYKEYVFQGGEPLMYPEHLLEIADIIADKQPGAKFRVFTNATHLTYPLVEELNQRFIQATVSIEPNGYKGINNFILKHALEPENAIRNIRLLHERCVRTVLTAEKIASGTFADDILLLHNFLGDIEIEVAMDLTNLQGYTLADMEALRMQLDKLRSKAPNYSNWLVMLQGFAHRCEQHTDWFILETEEFTEKCAYDKRPASGCAALWERMSPEVYEAYTEITRRN